MLPNVNPDAAFGVQVAIEDSLARYQSATFQIAVLYTSSKGRQCSIPPPKTSFLLARRAAYSSAYALLTDQCRTE